MSGSPIISRKRLIGVLVGGPVLPGQRELLLFSELISIRNYVEAWEGLVQLQSLDTEYEMPVFQNLVEDLQLRWIFAQLISSIGSNIPNELLNVIPVKLSEAELEDIKQSAIMMLINSSYLCIRFGKRKANYSNTGISIESAMFMRADEIIQEFLMLYQGGIDFNKIVTIRSK